MDKISINRLLRVFVPFIIMVMAQNFLMLLFGKIGISGTLPTLTAFILSATAAAFLFHIKLHGNDEEQSEETKKRPLASYVMYLFLTAAMMIIAMYAVSSVVANYSHSEVSVTPLYVVSLLVIHPIFEEYVFRSLFYSELRKINVIFALTAQAIMFAIIHSSIDGMIYALFSGILLGFAMEKTNKLWIPIVAHMFINARSLAYLTVLATLPALRQRIDTVVVALGVIGLIILLIVRTKGGAESASATIVEPSEIILDGEESDND